MVVLSTAACSNQYHEEGALEAETICLSAPQKLASLQHASHSINKGSAMTLSVPGVSVTTPAYHNTYGGVVMFCSACTCSILMSRITSLHRSRKYNKGAFG